MKRLPQLLGESLRPQWTVAENGLVSVGDPLVLQKLQDIMNLTHKKEDNWTRDRGCKLHGVNGCVLACAFKNKVTVPTHYEIKMAFRNQNADLWQNYTMMRTAIGEECRREGEAPFAETSVATQTFFRGCVEGTPLDSKVNEWYLFHGTKLDACHAICSTNFRLAMAGSGATWKEKGKTKGVPLYGDGIYMAERATKADEYAGVFVNEDGEETMSESGEPLRVMMLCRVVGGRANVVTTNEIEIDKLRADVFAGPYHSVFGDRVASLGKPFKEVVVYDKDQVYPEFLLVYERKFG